MKFYCSKNLEMNTHNFTNFNCIIPVKKILIILIEIYFSVILLKKKLMLPFDSYLLYLGICK